MNKQNYKKLKWFIILLLNFSISITIFLKKELT